MQMIESMARELEYEAGLTRKLLERVPEEHLDWRPHPKSFSLRGLASHLAESLAWVGGTFRAPSMDASGYKAWVGASLGEILGEFDRNLADAQDALKDVTDEDAQANWKLTADGHTLFEMPRAAVLRTMILNHLVHHRGQMTVYLRLKDVPLPALYGPSADEQ